MKKEEIYAKLASMKQYVEEEGRKLSDEATVDQYQELVYEKEGKKVWTAAIQKALEEHEIVKLPAKNSPYYLDGSLLIPGGRQLLCEDDTIIKQMEDVKVLMLRNANAKDGSDRPIREPKDCNITIRGGIWEESWEKRMGYGKSGMYDENRSFFGVSTCMLFSNVKNLTLENLTFVHTAGFAVQIGDTENLIAENITFKECFADGLHINGNCENVLVRNVKGQVGDDLVAFNLYDWKNSSINFGPVNNVLCEDLELSGDSRYKAIRLEPGIYRYEDGTEIGCALTNAVFKKIKGISTYKLYLQTPRYERIEDREFGKTGSGDYIYFEDIDIDLEKPIDALQEYLDSDPVKGSIAGFELGSNIGHLFFENIRICLHKEKYPMSFFLCIGPKSANRDGKEVFDPQISSHLEELSIKNVVCVDGEEQVLCKENEQTYIHEIVFEEARGSIGRISYQ